MPRFPDYTQKTGLLRLIINPARKSGAFADDDETADVIFFAPGKLNSLAKG